VKPQVLSLDDLSLDVGSTDDLLNSKSTGEFCGFVVECLDGE